MAMAMAMAVTVSWVGSAGASRMRPEGDPSSVSSSTTATTEAPVAVDSPITEPAELLNEPVIAVKTDDPTLQMQIGGLTEKLAGAVVVQLLPTDGMVAEPDRTIVVTTDEDGGDEQLEPAEILGLLQTLLALQSEGFVRTFNTDPVNPSIKVGAPILKGEGIAPELVIRQLEVEVPTAPSPDPPPPNSTSSSRPVPTGPERSTPSPQQSAPQTSPTTDTSSPNLDSDDPIATTPSTTDPAPDPSSEEPAGDISPYTSARPPATDDDEAGASATSNGIRRPPPGSACGCASPGTEPMSLNPVAGEQNEYSTADVSDRLAQADWEGPLLVEVQFDLVPSAAAPSDEDDPQFR
ncbi:MAG: hypothetical protein IPF42_14955 [Candidatus Microthrix sp.]|nr:hypothetical protein [Candidatus Microthrix sp.]